MANLNLNRKKEKYKDLYMAASKWEDMDVPFYSLSDFTFLCKHCSAPHFSEESVESRANDEFFGCCNYGNFVNLSEFIDEYPNDLKVLFSPENPLHKFFIPNIRKINSSFSVASLACNRFDLPGNGPPVFKINGQIYHKFNHIAQPINDLPTNGQLYFIDSGESINIRTKNNDIDKNLMEKIDNILRDSYPYAQSYKFLKEVVDDINEMYKNSSEKVPDVKLLFSMKEGYDLKRYNIPVSNEVFAIVVTNADGEIPPANIVVHQRGNKELRNLYPLDQNVEPMTYGILYPNKTRGWSYGIKDKKGKNISLCDFVKYRLYIRENIFLAHHYAGKLFQQWVVDMAARIEWDRLKFIRTHQKELKRSSYKGLDEFLKNKADKTGAEIGKKIILPSSFIGCPRNMEENFLDAMAIVNDVGKPDLFLTFTMNPNDPDIKKCLKEGQSPNDRPEIVARVFDLKREKLIEYIVKERVFGTVIGYCWVVEFQKRGLPHLHMLITLHPDSKFKNKDLIDKTFSAELPDKEKRPELFDIVSQFMMHGPCNSSSQCWNQEKNRCNKKFPKKFTEETTMTDDGYANYKRPNNGRFVYKKGQRLTNEFVVPYSPWLLLTFKSHINAELVASIKAVKYIYKYIYKGYDSAIIQAFVDTMTGVKKILNYDEVSNYLDGRCISPVEACMRIFKFHLQGKSHSVVKLDIHLENEQAIYFADNEEEEEIQDKMEKKSKLMAYFKFVEKNPNLDILYPQMPKYCTWIAKTGEWKYPRATQSKKCIGRIYTVSPKETEKYYLRYLMLHSKFKSYDDVKTFNGIKYDTYAQVCLARGLIKNDEEWHNCLLEASKFKFPKVLRSLFSTILVHCAPKYPENLWNEFKDELSQDLQRHYPTKDKAYSQALYLINQQLVSNNLSLNDYKNMPQLTGNEDRIDDHDVYDPKEEAAKASQLFSLMNKDQKSIITEVNKSLQLNKRILMFIDGPGGTGKSYTLKTIFHMIRANNKIVSNMAFSGVAATILQHGRTVHNRFKLPLNLNGESTSGIEYNTKEGNEIKNTDYFVWDEAAMSPRFALNVIDKKLKELTKNNISFGDKSMLLSGDFRQCLPIKKHGNRSEIVDMLIKNSSLWKEFKIFKLTENMRADPQEKDFAEYLILIGNGETTDPDFIDVPSDCICNGDLIDEIFSDILKSKDFSLLSGRAILAPYNSEVDHYNSEILNRFPGNSEEFLSIDETEKNGDFDIPIEVLNNLKCPGLPDHKIVLKKDCIAMLLRNLDVRMGLCNGTRIQILDWGNNVLRGIILTGDRFGEQVFLPRITLIEDSAFPFLLRRHQFPIKLSFAFTINKSQAQTFEKIGLDLTRDIFAHGQTYVALSRAKRWSGIKIKLGKK